MTNTINMLPNPGYQFCFVAGATETEDTLLAFLSRVRAKARELGFDARVISEVWDSRMNRKGSWLYNTGVVVVKDKALKGLKGIRAADATNFDPQMGTCDLWPKQGLLLLVSETDSPGKAEFKAKVTILDFPPVSDTEERVSKPTVCFGFMRWPDVVRNSHGRPVADTGTKGKWIFINRVTSPDPRYREIVKMFGEAGYLQSVLDEFNPPPSETPHGLRCPTCGSDVSKVVPSHAPSW